MRRQPRQGAVQPAAHTVAPLAASRRRATAHIGSALLFGLLGGLFVVACGGGEGGSPTAPPPAPPTVSAVSPTNGPLAGGTAVSIAGTNFVGITAVRFGASQLQNLSVVSGTQITGNVPAGAGSGAADVTVASSSHGNGTCAGCYTYNPA